MKLISIIIPCFKQACYLIETLESVLNQKYLNWECIIVNDGSPDNTEEIALNWCKKDARFIYLKKENGGLSSARNAGIEIAKGDYIQFLDSDDLIDSEKFTKSINRLNQEDDSVIVCNFKMFSKFRNKIEFWPPFCDLKQEYLTFESILKYWDQNFSIPIHCGLFPKTIFKEIRFNEKLKAKEDWLFWITISKLGFSFQYIDECLAYYRTNESSMTRDPELMKNNTILALKEIKSIINEADYNDFIFHKLEFLISENYRLNQKNNELNLIYSEKFWQKIKKLIKKVI